MSTKWETYQVGNGVRLRAVGARQTKVVVATPAKAELVAAVDKRGLDTSGTKAEIAERLNG